MTLFTAKNFSSTGWSLFTSSLLMASLLLFSWPVIIAWHLAFDGNIVYWFGTFLFWWTIPIPFWFFGVYATHMIIRPGKSLVTGSIVIPCVVIFLLGGVLQSRAGHLATKLRNRDCGTFPLIRKLELSLFEAQEKQEQCLASATHPNVLFNGCNQYEKWLEEGENGRHWPYLQYLESQFECTGFCTSGRPIWMYAKEAGKDPCASALALFLESQVMYGAKQMMGSSISLVFVTVIWVFLTKPTIEVMKQEKKRREALFGKEARPEDGFSIPKFNLPWGFGFPQKKSTQEPLFYPSPPAQQAPVQVVSAPPAVFQQTSPWASSPPVQQGWASSPPVQVLAANSPTSMRSYSVDSSGSP